ncbi:unnamed protein product, partial [Rotaria socialis]
MSDGTMNHYMYIGASARKPLNIAQTEILSAQPDIVHILIVVRLLEEYRPIFVFGQHVEEHETTILVIIPLDIEEARRNIIDPIPTTEIMLLMKPSLIVPVKDIDHEADGTILYAHP